MSDLDNISEEEQELYEEVFAEEEAKEAERDDWWPLARKGLIVLAILGALVWWLGTDTMEARDARAQWITGCRGEAPRDMCEDVADDFHDICYYDYAKGQSWLHRFDKLHAVVTGNRQKQVLYRQIPEYIDFLYIECLDERLDEAKKKSK